MSCRRLCEAEIEDGEKQACRVSRGDFCEGLAKGTIDVTAKDSRLLKSDRLRSTGSAKVWYI